MNDNVNHSTLNVYLAIEYYTDENIYMKMLYQSIHSSLGFSGNRIIVPMCVQCSNLYDFFFNVQNCVQCGNLCVMWNSFCAMPVYA